VIVALAHLPESVNLLVYAVSSFSFWMDVLRKYRVEIAARQQRNDDRGRVDFDDKSLRQRRNAAVKYDLVVGTVGCVFFSFAQSDRPSLDV